MAHASRGGQRSGEAQRDCDPAPRGGSSRRTSQGFRGSWAGVYCRTVNRDEVLTRLRDRLGPAPEGLVAVYLFGSVARGHGRASSDVDVAVLYEVTPPATLEGMGFDLASDLEAAVGRPVDLVVLNRAPADLIHRVLRDGILVVERDRSRRIAFEVKARNEYFDLAPIRERYRRMKATT